MLGADAAALLADIREEWDRAEATIKLAEQVSLEIVTPAIKELRYAGRRLVDALNGAAAGKSDAEIKALVENAKFDCYRARHDAVDASFSKIAVELDLLMKKLGYKAVLVAYPNVEQFLQKLDLAKQRIAATRENRHQRDEVYADIMSVDFPGLIIDYQALRRSEAIMRRVAAKDRLAFWVAVILAVIGYGLAAYFWKYPVAPTTAPIVQPTAGLAPAGLIPKTARTANGSSPPVDQGGKSTPRGNAKAS